MKCGKGEYRSTWVWFVALFLSFGSLTLIAGCPLAPGPSGNENVNDNVGDTGTLGGTVTNSLTGSGISGATIALDPEVEGVDTTTGEDGTYSAEVPAGDYALTFEADDFESQTGTVSVVAGETATVDVGLSPVAGVVLSTSVDGDAAPGSSVSATVSVEILDGSTIESYSWAQSPGLPATIAGAATDTVTVTLPDTDAYKAELLSLLVEPAIGEDDLPPYVQLPEGEFPGGLQDRFQVVGLDPFTLEEVGLIALELTVTTTSGEFTAEVAIHTELPWAISPGLLNVPTGRSVLLQGKTQDSYDWALAAPGGSGASLVDADTQNPYFTPDVVGSYTVTVMNTTVDPAEDVSLEIEANTWVGAITGQDADGRPLADNCTVCHVEGGFAPDMFTPWAQTGHAEIFSDNVDTSTHYGEGCFSCHTVGYDPDAENGGFDGASSYQDFLDAGLLNVPGENWTTVLADFPETAQLANIQCENCHGPQPGTHGGAAAPGRTSLSSYVCAVCHGEPLRHARFQQWQLSAHANYELAIDESDSGSCSRCHTGNGFLAWSELDPPFDPDTNVTVDWTADEAHPQTCVVCHDPHSVGTTTGVETDATMRIFGDTPPLTAGFTATDVGNGAICMTCHNSRRGLRNDATFDGTDTARAPHGAAQTDVLMGQNAYFVEVDSPGSHATEIEDTCVNCHMEQTTPPDLLAYNSGGTNHTFAASPDICANCHGFGPEVVQPGIEASLDELQGLMEGALLDLITVQLAAAPGNSIDLDGDGVADITDASDIADIAFGESHGRQAITVGFTGGTTIGPVRMNDVDVLDASAEVLGELYDFADDTVIKAGWNWNLVNNDGSKGVHNPGFAGEALNAAIDALNELAGG